MVWRGPMLQLRAPAVPAYVPLGATLTAVARPLLTPATSSRLPSPSCAQRREILVGRPRRQVAEVAEWLASPPDPPRSSGGRTCPAGPKPAPGDEMVDPGTGGGGQAGRRRRPSRTTLMGAAIPIDVMAARWRRGKPVVPSGPRLPGVGKVRLLIAGSIGGVQGMSGVTPAQQVLNKVSTERRLKISRETLPQPCTARLSARRVKAGRCPHDGEARVGAHPAPGTPRCASSLLAVPH